MDSPGFQSAIVELARSLVASPHLGALIGTDHRIEHATPAALELLGYPADTPSDTIDWVAITPPEHRVADDDAITEALRTGTSGWYRKEYLRPDQSRVAVELLAVATGKKPFRWMALIRPAPNTTHNPTVDLKPMTTGLLQLARRLAGAGSTDEVLNIVDRLVASTLGASYANLAMLDDEGRTLVLHHDPALPSDVNRRWPTVPVTADTLLGDAVLRRRTLICHSLAELRAAYPQQGGEAEDLGYTALAATPLRTDDGTLLGALGVAWTTGAVVDPEHLQVVADLVANAVGLARQIDVQRMIANTFQQMLLPPTEALSTQLEVVVRYRSVDRGPGGDFYDVIDRDGGGVWLVVGDVVGSGVKSARTMGKIRFFIRALAPRCETAMDLLRGVDQLLHAEGQGEIATCVIALWDPAPGTLAIATAGHPPPITVVGAFVEPVEVRPRPPLGVRSVDLSASPPPIADVILEAPDRVIVYSDGLVERRGEPLDESISRLALIIAGLAEHPLTILADQLLETIPDTTDDDIALLCVDIPRVSLDDERRSDRHQPPTLTG